MSKIKVAGGVGDSKVFAAPEGTFVTGVDRILDCHINQVLISEMNLDPQVLSALDYWATDEGIKEKADRPDAKYSDGTGLTGIEVEPSTLRRRWVAEYGGVPAHFEEFTRDGSPFGKALDQRTEQVKEQGMELYQARDPFQETREQYEKPGMASKFLSRRRIQENGNSTGIYNIVKNEKGDPVTVRGSVLGHTPQEVATARNKFFQDRGNNQLKQMTKKYLREGGATAAKDPTI